MLILSIGSMSSNDRIIFHATATTSCINTSATTSYTTACRGAHGCRLLKQKKQPAQKHPTRLPFPTLKYGLQVTTKFYQSSSGTHHFLVSVGDSNGRQGVRMLPNFTDGAKAEICRVPASMVLQSNFQKSDWDSQLACQLDECNDKAVHSVRSSIARPTTSTRRETLSRQRFTTLRHWSPAQRQLLAFHSRSRTVGFGGTSGSFLAKVRPTDSSIEIQILVPQFVWP
jgi:hypothetical protein